jgi:Transglutaminase-like superfamily
MGWLKSRNADWRMLCALSGRERRLLAVSMLLLPAVVLAHRWMGFGRVQRVLSRLLPCRASASDSEHQGMEVARRLSRIVRIAANRSLCHATCLQQSVFLQQLLVRYGIAAYLRIGVRNRDGILEAHAWVECLGHVLNEREDVSARFAPFPRRMPGILTSEK